MFLENVAYEVSWNECVRKLCENIDWECYLRMIAWEVSDSCYSNGFWEIANNDYLKEFLRDLIQWIDADTFEKWFWEIALKDVIWKLIPINCCQQFSTSRSQRFLRSDSERLLQTIVNVSLPKITSWKVFSKTHFQRFSWKMEHQ